MQGMHPYLSYRLRDQSSEADGDNQCKIWLLTQSFPVIICQEKPSGEARLALMLGPFSGSNLRPCFEWDLSYRGREEEGSVNFRKSFQCIPVHACFCRMGVQCILTARNLFKEAKHQGIPRQKRCSWKSNKMQPGSLVIRGNHKTRIEKKQTSDSSPAWSYQQNQEADGVIMRCENISSLPPRRKTTSSPPWSTQNHPAAKHWENFICNHDERWLSSTEHLSDSPGFMPEDALVNPPGVIMWTCLRRAHA